MAFQADALPALLIEPQWAGPLASCCCQEQDAMDLPAGARHFGLAKADLSEAMMEMIGKKNVLVFFTI